MPNAWTVHLSAYNYEILDATDREIVAYQWHPQGRSPITWPHFHLGPAAGELWRPLSRAHFPTGMLSIQDVLQFAIREFGVSPRRANWETVLSHTRDTLKEHT